MADAGFPKGRAIPKIGINLLFGRIFRKLHEKEENLAAEKGRGGTPLLLCRSATGLSRYKNHQSGQKARILLLPIEQKVI